VTEQTKSGDAANLAFADTVGPLFNMWAYREGRECLRADLIEAGPAEMVQQFRKTAQLLDGLATYADYIIGFGAGRVLLDARRLAEEACEIAEDHAGEEAFGA
jgi:hypothetical protein